MNRKGTLRTSIAMVLILALVGTMGCGSVGRTVGLGLAGVGTVAAVTTGVLAMGCSTPNPNNPQIEDRGPCLPAQTYEDNKPIIWTGFVLGIIVAAAGVAIATTATESAAKNDPVPRDPPARDPLDGEPCTDAQKCY